METCTADFMRLARELGGIECAGHPIVTITNPTQLHHWTMVLLELTLVVGAIASLVHAVLWRRRHGDSTNLVVWCASVLSLLLIEPITYFPNWFGLQDKLGLIFVHNQFTVQFFENRLPLYIVAVYPAFAYVAFVIIQRTGVFERFRPIVGAVCVAFTFHVLYEVFDNVGPQLRWWVWNTEVPISKPALGAVPFSNIQAFSLGLPFGIALVTLWVARGRDHGRWRIFRDVVIVSVACWPVMLMTSIPATVLDLLGFTAETARGIATPLLVVAAAFVTVWALVVAHRARTAGELDLPEGIEQDRFGLISVGVFMLVFAVIWISAIPEYLDASGGRTLDGAPIGSLAYAVVAALAAMAIVASTHLGRTPVRSERSRVASGTHS